jgi:hypothetical protein
MINYKNGTPYRVMERCSCSSGIGWRASGDLVKSGDIVFVDGEQNRERHTQNVRIRTTNNEQSIVPGCAMEKL